MVDYKLFQGPKSRLTLAIASCLFFCFLTIQFALKLPEFKEAPEIGQSLNSSKYSLVLEEIDFVAEPGEIVNQQELERFFERQNLLTQILNENKALTRVRQISDLPLIFWVQILVGFGAFSIAGWILALRAGDLGARLFALSGFSTLMFTFSAAIYSTRPLSLPSDIFKFLTQLNAFGASLFGISTLILFLVYPERIKNLRLVALSICLLFLPATILSLFGLTPDWINVNFITFLEMLGILAALGVQYFLTRHQRPQSRAILTWLGFSFGIGAGAFIFLNAFPIILGSDLKIEQGYGFLFFLLIYIGVAAGFRHYRLFEIGDWAFKLFFHVIGAFALLAIDAALIFLVGLDRLPALSISLLLVALVYLPMRNYLFSRFWSKDETSTDELLAMVINVIFSRNASEREERWKNLLRSVFRPLELRVQNIPTNKVQIDHSGINLSVPSISQQETLTISYPFEGKRLYTPAMVTTAQKLSELANQAEDKRAAYERGVLEERSRITKDLHDDVGARLLTNLHEADEKTRPLFQAALTDIRNIVHELASEKQSLRELLADIRYESKQRLEIVSIDLHWRVNLEDHIEITGPIAKTIKSSMREVVSNVIKHSQASCFNIDIEAQENKLTISMVDNGQGFQLSSNTGFGLKSLKKRIEEIKGHMTVNSSNEGTQFFFEIYL